MSLSLHLFRRITCGVSPFNNESLRVGLSNLGQGGVAYSSSVTRASVVAATER